MKKTISILLALLLLSSMAAGCGSKEEAPQTEPAPAATQASPAEAETEAPAEPEMAETTAAAAEALTVPMGKWIGYYIEDIQGLRVPMGKEQGMCLDILLEEGGKATLFYYIAQTEPGKDLSEEGVESTAEAYWTGAGDELQIVSKSEEYPGTYNCKYLDGILYIKAFPAIGSFLKMGLPGTPEAENLKGGAESAAELLKQVENGGSGHSH